MQRINAGFLLPILFTTGSAQALDWRVDVDWQAEHQYGADGVLSLVEPEPAAWRQRYDARLIDQGAQLDLRFQPRAQPDWLVRQAFYDGAIGGWEVTLGQKQLAWDYGFLAKPLNWLGPPDGLEEGSAEPLVSVQRFRGLDTDQAVCTLRLDRATELCLVRTQGFTGPFDWQAMVGHEDGWRLGAGTSVVLGRRWELHASAHGRETGTRYRFQSNQVRQSEGTTVSTLVGAHVSGRAGWQLWLEHGWDNRALSRDDWRALNDRLDSLAGTSAAMALAPAWQAPVLTRHRSMLRLTQALDEQWDLTASLIGFWGEPLSGVSDLKVNYAWSRDVDLSINWRTTQESGMLGRIGQGNAVTVNWNWVLAP